MPALGGRDAPAITRRLAARICDTPIATDAGAIRLTLSIGLADATGCADVEGLLARADEALYEVKRRGRDGVHQAVTG
jgi:PleD family two-component response regulator